ncbi:Hypothetical_protein [Hexamita inflata]|uniref:Hypothetical_protein n=1 Tax=Hexamita inflata TaxID=28002 RepID=A0AA86PEC2_9EUKA|nr:Hypothetical protein HINF_LOCUS23453 [Hexamita inflata]
MSAIYSICNSQFPHSKLYNFTSNRLSDSSVETYENSACGGHSCVCRGELSELGQGRNEVLRVRPARRKQQSEYLALSLRILSAPPPRQMPSAPIMASVQITRRTGCLGGGICNDRIRSHKLTCRVAEVGSISGLTLAIQHGAYCGRRIYQTHCATQQIARHRRSLWFADAKNRRQTPADLQRPRVTRAATSLFTGVRVHCRGMSAGSKFTDAPQTTALLAS